MKNVALQSPSLTEEVNAGMLFAKDTTVVGIKRYLQESRGLEVSCEDVAITLFKLFHQGFAKVTHGSNTWRSTQFPVIAAEAIA